jgi:hypothetical protein
MQSLDSRELQSDAIVLQNGPVNELTSLQSFFGLSIYGGNDVQPPSTASITASLGSGKAPVNSVPVGRGGLLILPSGSA